MAVIVSMPVSIQGSVANRARIDASLSFAENDETFLDKPVHEARVLVEGRLLAQTLRPVPGAAVLLVNEQELSHGPNGTPGIHRAYGALAPR